MVTHERVAVVSESAPMRTTSSSRWFPVPKELDASELAALLSTYLPALRILRYAMTFALRKRLLIASQAPTPLTGALERLSKIELGTREVYTTPSPAVYVDMVIDFSGSHWEHVPHSSLICCRSPRSVLEDILERTCLMFASNAAIYDLDETPNPKPEELNYLLDLLTRRRVRPEIDQFVSLDELKHLKDDKPGTGVVVCEPWKV